MYLIPLSTKSADHRVNPENVTTHLREGDVTVCILRMLMT